MKDHVSDLRETFTNIRRHHMRLNPAKCSFGLTSGKFLGFLISQRGIEIDPNQIKSINNLKDPTSIKEVQKLTGCIAALRRFIPHASKRCLPVFRIIKDSSKSRKFLWSEECKKSFIALKEFLTNPPILTRALPCETLKVYISACDHTVTAVLVREEESKERPVYYVSHSLKDAETRYPQIEKVVYSLVIASRKLQHYFQGRQLQVMTKKPLKRILHKPDITWRLESWTIKLSQFHMESLPRTAIKAQALSYFVAECQFSTSSPVEETQTPKPWTLFVDGSSTESLGGAGIILISPEGFKVQQVLKFSFPVTNNMAEYEALIVGVKLALELGIQVLDIFGDSQLVVKQLNGEFKAHNDRMASYLELSRSLLQKVPSWRVTNIAREENQWADALSKLASSSIPLEKEPIYMEERSMSALDQIKVSEIYTFNDWRQPILDYILRNDLPKDKLKARSLVYKARNYCIMNDKL